MSPNHSHKYLFLLFLMLTYVCSAFSTDKSTYIKPVNTKSHSYMNAARKIHIDKPTPLMKAILNGELPKVLEQIINTGIDINERDASGYTAIHYLIATTPPGYRRFKVLYANGADIYAESDNGTSLFTKPFYTYFSPENRLYHYRDIISVPPSYYNKDGTNRFKYKVAYNIKINPFHPFVNFPVTLAYIIIALVLPFHFDPKKPLSITFYVCMTFIAIIAYPCLTTLMYPSHETILYVPPTYTLLLKNLIYATLLSGFLFTGLFFFYRYSIVKGSNKIYNYLQKRKQRSHQNT